MKTKKQMKQEAELLIKCIDYTLYMKEIPFDKKEIQIIKALKESLEEHLDQPKQNKEKTE